MFSTWVHLVCELSYRWWQTHIHTELPITVQHGQWPGLEKILHCPMIIFQLLPTVQVWKYDILVRPCLKISYFGHCCCLLLKISYFHHPYSVSSPLPEFGCSSPWQILDFGCGKKPHNDFSFQSNSLITFLTWFWWFTIPECLLFFYQLIVYLASTHKRIFSDTKKSLFFQLCEL